jgi:hypothetical protein
MKTYYLALNPKTDNWCISKTKDIAWTITGRDNVIADTGSILADKAIAFVREYCRNNPNVVVLNS